jgi:hypothetical protein
MSELKTATEQILVHLTGPDGEVRDYHLSLGSTLGDLLRRTSRSTEVASVLVDGVPPEHAVLLRDGAVVTMLPKTDPATNEPPWRMSIPSFQDEALYQEFREELEAHRREVRLLEDHTS